MKKYKPIISGHLDMFVIQNEDVDDGEIVCWNDISIHGDPEGLRSFANLLLKLADLDQESIANLPIGAREHRHLQAKYDLSNSSENVILGRLDAKGTGAFYNHYISKEVNEF
jgi:hypothetical protein